MNQELANKIRALPIYNHRSGARLVNLADVLGIVEEPEPVPAAETPSTEAAAPEENDEPQPNKVARFGTNSNTRPAGNPPNRRVTSNEQPD